MRRGPPLVGGLPDQVGTGAPSAWDFRSVTVGQQGRFRMVECQQRRAFMFARIGTFHSAPEQVDDDVAQHARERALSSLRELPGFIGLHVFADRQTGTTIGLSLWETEAALRAFEHLRRAIVADQAAGAGHTEQESANYELVFSSGDHFM